MKLVTNLIKGGTNDVNIDDGQIVDDVYFSVSFSLIWILSKLTTGIYLHQYNLHYTLHKHIRKELDNW